MMGFIICTLHQTVFVGMRNAYTILVQQHAGKITIRRLKCRKENDIKKDLNGRMWIKISLARTGYRTELLWPQSFCEFCKQREIYQLSSYKIHKKVLFHYVCRSFAEMSLNYGTLYKADKYTTARQPYTESWCTSQTRPITSAVQCVRREARLKIWLNIHCSLSSVHEACI
jgi:hypothetical protein